MHFLGLMIEHDRKPKKCMTWLDAVTGIFLWTATLEKLVCLQLTLASRGLVGEAKPFNPRDARHSWTQLQGREHQ